MDYNFLVAQSGVGAIAALREAFRRQMLDTYLDYFSANYTGNRAPLHIGHHFTDYQSGAYREALKIIRARGLRPAGGALRQLQDAGRYHGRAKRRRRSPPIARAISRACAACPSSVGDPRRGDRHRRRSFASSRTPSRLQ